LAFALTGQIIRDYLFGFDICSNCSDLST